MASFCLPKFNSEKFLQGLRDGKITPEKLASFESSAERREYLKDFVGEEHAKEVNTLIESKMLLKDFKTGLVTAVKKMTGLKPEFKKDIFSKIERMGEILNPVDEKAFLEDIASKKLGTEVTFEEAKKINELSKSSIEAKAKPMASTEEFIQGKETPEQKANRLAYGETLRQTYEYVDEISKKTNKDIITNIANIPKTLLSTLDFSAPLRQGWGMLSRGEFYKAFPKMFKYAFSEKAYNELQADILSRPTYDAMNKGGLRISAVADKLSAREEQFMSKIANKIPGVAGSERAYVGFLNKLRADTFDHLLQNADMAGENIKDTQTLKDLANVVNDFTGSGNIGKGDRYANTVPAGNAALFSPRKLSATINMFNPKRYLDPSISKTARVAALRQLLGSVAITSTALGLAKIAGAKVETNPESSDFGKVVVGKTHYDLTGGNGTYAVLLSRLATNKTKSTTTGKITKLGEGYKPTTRADVALKFGRNKLSPAASFIADWAYGTDSIGKKFNAKTEVINRLEPLILQDLQSMVKDDPNQAALGTIVNSLGVGVSTY
jgi:hypothetical protein